MAFSSSSHTMLHRGGLLLTRVELALTILFCAVAKQGECFLFAGSSITRSYSQTCRSSGQHQQYSRVDHDHAQSDAAPAINSNRYHLRPPHTFHSRHGHPLGLLHMSTADSLAQEQQLPTVGAVDTDNGEVEGMPSTSATARATHQAMVRTGVATDGTALVFRIPSTQELHQLQMGKWVGRKSIFSALVALRRDNISVETESEMEPRATGPPLACALVEAMDGVGGSSVATRVCLLRHTKGDGVLESVEHALLDEAITQFLNGGSRISQLRVQVEDDSNVEFYARHGFVLSETIDQVAGGRFLLSGNRDAALMAVRGMTEQENNGAVVMNLLARLLHDAGDVEGAVNAYLKAVQMDPCRSEVFRGLGGAYQSQGQHQMAFASYQQAINLCPTDLLAYLKLGFLYEQLAVGKYEEAGDHAIRCFDYYLQNSGSEDTDILTRLGNLQVRRLDPAGAVKTYERALAADASLANVWFNLANAHLKLGHEEEATRCLHEQIRLDPEAGVATKYLLASLESASERLTKEDQLAYVRELFDYYAPSYDDHMRKKLLYTAPRILRQNVREVYNATFQALPEATRLDHNYDVLSYLNQTLDILDLGCGTGLIGSWFKDYGRRIVGVDISSVMLDMATKKGCYHELRKGDLRDYLAASDENQFDVVVAAETPQYLGPLEGMFSDAFTVLKPGGLMAFTVGRPERESEAEETSDQTAEDNERSADTDGPRDTEDTIELPGSAGGYSLKTDGRYRYERPYLIKLARLSGYEIVVLKRHAARIERGEPAPGYLGIFRKPLG